MQYGRRFKAFCLYLLNYQLLPYDRTGELLETLLGYQPGGGTLQRLLEQAYATLEPIEQAIKGAIRASPVGHGDETSIRVEGRTQWLHVVSTLAYTYYDGMLMHDAYRSYFGHTYRHALGNAHLLRELQTLYETDPSQRWTWQLIRWLRTVWALVKAAPPAGPPPGLV